MCWKKKKKINPCDNVHIGIVEESLQDDDDPYEYEVYSCKRNSLHNIRKRHAFLACVFDEYVSEACAVNTKIYKYFTKTDIFQNCQSI